MNIKEESEELMSESYETSFSRKNLYFNDLVVAEMIFTDDDKRIGRLVQIRKGVGAFGSDLLFLRMHDGSLMSFENVALRPADDKQFEDAFYWSNGRKPPVIRPVDEYQRDEPNIEYTMLGGKYPETGFIIKSPRQPHSDQQSFAMTIIEN